MVALLSSTLAVLETVVFSNVSSLAVVASVVVTLVAFEGDDALEGVGIFVVSCSVVG